MDSLVFFSLNTAEKAMDLLNIGISVLSGLPLKSNVQIGHTFLMYEVIGKA